MQPLVTFRGGLRLAGHPLHAMLVHFPLGLWMLVFPLELAGRLWAWETGWELAFWASLLAGILALPTAVSGLWDFAALGQGAPEPAARAANLHMYVMLSTTAVFLVELFVRLQLPDRTGPGTFLNLGLSLCGMLLLTWGGWLGGELVFRHGVGRAEK